jgi:hypothetical protein
LDRRDGSARLRCVSLNGGPLRGHVLLNNRSQPAGSVARAVAEEAIQRIRIGTRDNRSKHAVDEQNRHPAHRFAAAHEQVEQGEDHEDVRQINLVTSLTGHSHRVEKTRLLHCVCAAAAMIMQVPTTRIAISRPLRPRAAAAARCGRNAADGNRAGRHGRARPKRRSVVDVIRKPGDGEEYLHAEPAVPAVCGACGLRREQFFILHHATLEKLSTSTFRSVPCYIEEFWCHCL